MKHAFQPLLLFFMFMTTSHAADILQNPDFEIPPTNVTATNVTSQFLLLNQENTIPGWSFNGTVSYVTSGGNLSLPGNGHGFQLGENGKINQTFGGTKDYMVYILTFALAAQNAACANNFTAVNISVHYRSEYDHSDVDRSRVFYFGRNFSRNLWESHAFTLGQWGSKKDSINLEIKSVTTNLGQNFTCWPIVDSLIIRRNDGPRWYDGNLLANGGFEIGPAFIRNSSEGILLDQEPISSFYYDSDNPLEQWKILGTIKYIDSKHYKIPRGEAAVELLSGDPSGIQKDLLLQKKQTYTLNFTIGDANNSCVGYLIVYLQIGNNVTNFTMQSDGRGSVFKHSVTFKPEFESPIETSIIFYSFNETLSSDGVLCGPVLDSISLFTSSSTSLFTSYGKKIVQMYSGVMICSLFSALVILI